MPNVERVLDALLNGQWAILPNRLQSMYTIAKRETSFDEAKIEALAKKSGEVNEKNGRIEMREGVAVISIRGPIFRHANLFTAISGATSTDLLARALSDAEDDPAVSAILLNIDSPGGEVSGIHEMAQMVKLAREKKPVYAYAEATCASAAYWIASAADKIYIDPTAVVGSIGVISTFKKAKDDTIEIVSSNAPNKRLDLETDEGKNQIRSVLDDIAAVFTEDVANNRSVDLETVNTKFGKGGVVVGKSAVAVGMVDGLSSFEGVLDMLNNLQLEGGEMPDTKKAVETPLTAEELRAKYPEAVQELVKAELNDATSELSAQVEQLRVENLRKDVASLVGEETAEFLIGFYGKLESSDIKTLADKFAKYEATISELGEAKGVEATEEVVEDTPSDEKEEAKVKALAEEQGIPVSEAWAEYLKQKED